MSAEPTDDELWLAWRRGDAAAFEALYRRVSPDLYGFCRALCAGTPQDADDVLQETFRKAVSLAADYRGDGALTAWLASIARTTFLDLRRRRRRRLEVAIPSHADPPAPPEAPGAALDAEALLARLPEEEREAVACRVLMGLSIEETAEALGVSPATVKRRVAEGFLRLRSRGNPEKP